MSARRPRTPKDPAAPKAATSAQQFFMKSRREAVKLANPDLSSADLQKALADEWRELDEAGRAPFIAKAKTDKARHTKEASKYVPDPIHLKATKGGKRLQKDPLRPKKPKSAYLYFGEATRAELTSSNPGIRKCHPHPTRARPVPSAHEHAHMHSTYVASAVDRPSAP